MKLPTASKRVNYLVTIFLLLYFLFIQEPNELQVVVIQGRDLLICDTPSLLSFGKGGPGSSDPFVTLSVKG